jgi:type II secretory pathway pseudopilin PulG
VSRSSCTSSRAPRPEVARRRGIRLRGNDGFTLFETLIASVVLIVGLTALLGLLDVSVKAAAATRAREGATSLTREVLEDARTLAYAQISPTSIVGELQAMNGLKNESGGATWQIKRGGVTYTVAVKECAIDDPKDGFGLHIVGGENVFCKDPGEAEANPPVDSAPEDFKRITAEVTWVAKGRKPSVKQVETLTAAGEAPGLSASQLKLFEPKVEAPTAPVIIAQPSENKLVFSVQSPVGTKAMEWALDGVRQSNEPTLFKGTEWRFSWSIPLNEVSDGAYQVSVQAVDTTGVYGPPISITVTLIRSVPAAPKITYAGFNEIYVSGTKTQVVELQWQPNTERNVIGYRVYDPEKELVCPKEEATLSLEPSCIDFLNSPKSPNLTSPNLTYSVVALYRPAVGELLSNTAIAQGPAGTFTLSKTPLMPVTIGVIEAEKTPEGATTLHWTEVEGAPPVAFYRIYRDSKNYTGRYAAVSPATKTFTDTNAATEHEYWVTAVSETMTETPLLLSVKK